MPKYKKQVVELIIENERLRKLICDEQEHFQKERSQMRANPCFWPSGVYYFSTPYKDRYYSVEIFKGGVKLLEHHKDVKFVLCQIEPSRVPYL